MVGEAVGPVGPRGVDLGLRTGDRVSGCEVRPSRLQMYEIARRARQTQPQAGLDAPVTANALAHPPPAISRRRGRHSLRGVLRRAAQVHVRARRRPCWQADARHHRGPHDAG